MTRARSTRAPLVVTIAGSRVPAAARGLARWLERAAPRSARGQVAIALVGDQRMRALNRDFRGIDRATDVLSFPAEPAPRLGRAKSNEANELGDIAIALGVARRQAAAEGHSLGTELRVLALHGILHLLGYDHERDRGQMRRIENRLRRRAGLPSGLIARVPRVTHS